MRIDISRSQDESYYEWLVFVRMLCARCVHENHQTRQNHTKIINNDFSNERVPVYDDVPTDTTWGYAQKQESTIAMRAVRPEVRLLQKCAWMEAHQLRLAGCRGGREQSGAIGSWAAKMACRALCGMPLETNRRLQKARPSSSTAARLVVTHSR